MAQNTKSELAQGLVKLLSSKTLNNITVSDIVNASGYNRQTFYYHFHDVYELIEWIVDHYAEQNLPLAPTSGSWTKALLTVVNEMLKNKSLVLNLYSSVSSSVMDRYLYKISRHLTNMIVTAEAVRLDVSLSDGDFEFLSRSAQYILHGFLNDWIRDGMREKPETLCQRIDPLIRVTLPPAIAYYSHQNA
ncbi:MAG: TetR/AcrR family transcriptional regulator C-terminal domain-containing protein [Clostridia bacterium]|nr:TetR/AcrR family transcriptional regulator C-terminal domain-containing protein [Clostridia bacterium]